ncbi:unnamed protein product, partial [marine sediment metagenome]
QLFYTMRTLEASFDYVKIDVDGIELDIVRGMDLEDSKLKSVLIEVSNDNQKEITETFQGHGFKIDKRFEPESMKEHSSNHRKASGSPVRNVVFTREKKGT